MLTIDDARELSRRVEALVFGDDGSCTISDVLHFSGGYQAARLGKAVEEWYWQSRRSEWDFGSIYWSNREGQPWQADIEKWVSEWRAEPRPFATDDALAMAVLWPMLRDHLREKLYCGDNPKFMRLTQERYDSWGWTVDIGEWHPITAKGWTLAEAVCRAFLAACEKGSRCQLTEDAGKQP